MYFCSHSPYFSVMTHSPADSAYRQPQNPSQHSPLGSHYQLLSLGTEAETVSAGLSRQRERAAGTTTERSSSPSSSGGSPRSTAYDTEGRI